MLGQLITDVDAFAASLRRGQAVNVNDQNSKERAISLAKQYFSDVRPLVVSVMRETDEVLLHDKLWQQLVRLAHGNNARRTYVKIVGKLRRQLSEFNISALARPITSEAESQENKSFSVEENLILQTLESIVPSAAASYRQGLTDLTGPERSSYRGTATEFRESLRETLDYLAPDKDVEAQAWYSPEDDQAKPTMKQKVRFVLRSRQRNKTQRESAEKALVIIEQVSGELMRAVYSRASLATHVHQTKDEVRQIKRYVDTLLFDFLEIT